MRDNVVCPREVGGVARQVVWTIRQEWRAAVGDLRRGRGRAEGGSGRAPYLCRLSPPSNLDVGAAAHHHPTRPQCVPECWSDAGMISSDNLTNLIII